MKINDASNTHQSIYHLALRWALASSTDFPFDPDFVQSANIALDKLIALIMRNDNTWEWDDGNQADLPIATADLASGQDNYSIAVTHLKILRVRVKDQNGNWKTLNPIQRRELTDTQLAASGLPEGYDKLGGSIFLVPKPDYASTGGLELQFQRGASYFADDSTTKEPGFAAEFHELVALMPALDFCDINGKDKQAARIRERIGREPIGSDEGSGLLGAMAAFYRSRDYDRPQSLSLAKSNRASSTLL